MIDPATFRRDMLRLLRPPTIDATTLLLALLVVTGTNLIDFLTVPATGARPAAGFIAAAILRVALVFWISYALIRRMARAPRPLVVRWALLRFALLLILLGVGYGAAARIGASLVGNDAPLARQWLATLAATATFSLLTIRLTAWEAGLAAGEHFAALGRLWRGLRGATPAVALAYVAFVLPVAAVHLALTLVGVRLPLAPSARLALAVVDGIVSTGQLILASALCVTAWRVAVAKEGSGT